jgi:hypothetical protein
MRACPARRIRLVFAIPLILIAVINAGGAGAETLRVTSVLSPEYVRLSTNAGFQTIHVEDGPSKGSGAGQFHSVTDPGSPAIPFRVVRILLPEGQEVGQFEAVWERSEVLSTTFHPVTATAPLDPQTAQVKMLPRLIDSPEGGPFPAQPARYLGTGYWHGHAIASFAVFPFQVDGSRLILHRRITLTIESRPRTDSQTIARPQRLSRAQLDEIQNRLSALVVNRSGLDGYNIATVERPSGRFEPTPAPSLEGSPVEYLIITTEELVAAYQRLADWKTAKGVPTVIRTVEWIYDNHRRGVDIQETLRFFIRDAYEKWGVTYVLLGGDTPEIPTRYCWSTYYYGGRFIPVDLFFAGLDGTWNKDHDEIWGEPTNMFGDAPDLYAEVYLGRLPTSTVSDVDILIDKIFNYETPYDPSYMNKVMFLAEVLFPYPWNPGDGIDMNGADTAEYVIQNNPGLLSTDLVRAYETEELYPGSIHESRQQTLDSLNAGYNLVKHIGHGYRFNMHVGDANVLIADADTLSNQDRYCNLYLLNCTAVAFDFDCLAEHFLNNPNGGAVSVVGASESAFPTASVHYMDEYTRLLFGERRVHIGEAFTNSRLPRTPFAEMSDNADLWTHYIYTLLADPEMPLWIGPVDTLQVNHVAAVNMGATPIQVDVTTGGAPAESVLVCLWKDKDDYQTGLTDAAGTVTFDFVCESPGSVSVVATGIGHMRHQSWITVGAESGPYLRFDSLVVDDTTAGMIVGNGDGIIDAGETVGLYPVMRNSGGSASVWVTVALRSTDSLVTFADTLALVASIAPGQTGTAVEGWKAEFSTTAPDEKAIEFTITSAEVPAGGSWDDSFARLVHTPKLEFVTLRRDDSPPYGNGNGTIEDGEEFLLYCSIKNYGTGEAIGLSASISDLDGGFVFVDSIDTFPAVAPLSEMENINGLRLSETNTLIENRLGITIVDAYGRVTADTVEFREPAAPSDLSFDTSMGEDQILVRWFASPSVDIDRYRVYRSTTSGGPYVAANTDLVAHTVYTDVGLTPSTRYFYVVAGVDESGNESLYSDEAFASTNPPQLGGWPNVVTNPSTSSAAVGDVDGDGDMEVVVGNDHLYAWHDDGQELRDGDNDILTWGVFADQGDGFVASVALARLDGKPGLNIVAASLNTMEVFCYDHTGTVLPGWPQTTLYGVRAGMAVGDLDGDADFEIVAIDQNAYLYAWHHDGSEVRDGDGNPGTNGVFRIFPNTPWWHYQTPALCDLDGDGADEIIAATQDSTLYVMGGDGTDLPGWPKALPDFAGGGVAVGDIDEDGDLEIVCPSKNSSEIRAFHHDGSTLWVRWFAQGLFFNPSPALADLDSDGKLETVLPASNGKLYIIKYDGSDLPGWPVDYSTTTNSSSSPIVADISGDGAPDIILGDESKFINAWDVAGNLLDGFPLATQDAIRGTPAATDLDGDGDVEIIAAGYDRKVYVWDVDQPYDPDASPWPQFYANSHNNGRSGFYVATDVADDVAPLLRAGLEQNVPNPFNPTTAIVFHVPLGIVGAVSLVVYDVTGARVKTLADGPMTAGRHTREWNGTNHRGNRVSSGVYFYRLTMRGFVDTKKMVLLK